MNKKILIFALLFIFIAGCDLGGGPGQISYIDVYTGTEGMVLEFLEGSPPSEIYIDKEGSPQEFQIVFEMRNRGPTNVDFGFLSLEGGEADIDILDWKIREKKNMIRRDLRKAYFVLEGKSQFNPEGGFDTISISARTKRVYDPITKTPDIRVKTCYGYKTKLSDDICIDTDPYDLRKTEKPCTSQGSYSFSSQGAPVAVTAIEQENLFTIDSIRPSFKIYINNVGDGDIINKEYVEGQCMGEVKEVGREIKPKISVSKLTFSKFNKDNFDCDTERFNLVDHNYITCTLKDGMISKDEPTYSTTLTIELEYGYYETISKSMQIIPYTT